MTTKQLAFKGPVALAIAEGATSPNPGTFGVIAWSTTLGRNVSWDGSKWSSVVVNPEEVTATKPTLALADKAVLFDSAATDNPIVATLSQIQAAILPTISGPTPLGLWDWWYFTRIGYQTVSANDVFLGAAVSSGTNTTAIPTTGLAGYNTHGVFLRSGTTANGGYKYQTQSFVTDYFGTISHKFRCQYMPLTSFTGRTLRIGFHDSVTSADAVDGAYFEIVDAVCSAKTANNSTRTTNATTLTLSLNTAYTFDIDVNAAGTSARFRVYGGNSSTALLDVTITTNIPTTSARAFGAGIVATEVSTTASDIGILYSLGVGTIEGFQRDNLAQVLGDIETILAAL